MASSSPISDFPGANRSESLADVLGRGPLSLAAALRCATEVARLLHELHLQDRSYGKITPASVLVRSSGIELLPSRGFWDHATQDRDIQGFGGLLFELVTGQKVPADVSAALFRSAAPPSGPAGIRAAALRLSGKCLGHLSVKLTMQQAATEVRLLSVVARQLEASGVRESAAPSPFLVAPPATPPAPKAAARVIPLAHAPLPYARPRIEEPAPVESRRRAGKNTESDHVADEPAEPAVGPTGAPPLVPLEASNFSRTPEKPTAPLEPAGGKCPKCESTAVFHSRARSRLERLLERWQIPICRCHRCYHRYLVFARLKIAKEMPVGTERRFKPRRRR